MLPKYSINKIKKSLKKINFNKLWNFLSKMEVFY